MIVKEVGYKGWDHATYISNDGIEFSDEESCLDHENNQKKYEEIMAKLQIPLKVKQFSYEHVAEEEENFGLSFFHKESDFIWYKVNNVEEAKNILNGHLEYYQGAMDWAEQLKYPDYLGIIPGDIVIYRSFNELSENADLFIKGYTKYIESVRKQFKKYD